MPDMKRLVAIPARGAPTGCDNVGKEQGCSTRCLDGLGWRYSSPLAVLQAYMEYSVVPDGIATNAACTPSIKSTPCPDIKLEFATKNNLKGNFGGLLS